MHWKKHIGVQLKVPFSESLYYLVGWYLLIFGYVGTVSFDLMYENIKCIFNILCSPKKGMKYYIVSTVTG
jgi:hypothetical protein